MRQIDANTLVSYVDGELDGETAALVERELSSDDEAREAVRDMREVSALVRAAHHSVVYEVIPGRLIEAVTDTESADPFVDDVLPERLVNVILEAPESETRPGDEANDDSAAPEAAVISITRRRSVAAFAMAAAVASVLVGGGFLVGHLDMFSNGPAAGGYQRANISAAMNDPWREAAFQNALETKESEKAVLWTNPENGHSGVVMPIKSFRRDDGTFCRMFRTLEAAPSTAAPNVGIACREAGPDGRWIRTVQAMALTEGTPAAAF